MPWDADGFWNELSWPDLDLVCEDAEAMLAADLPANPCPGALALRYKSALHGGQPSRIFAYAALQQDPAAAPTLIFVHGGGGMARSLFGSRRSPYLRAAYNVFSLDLPGKGEQRDISRSTGPDMNDANLFQHDDPRDGYLYHAVQAVRRTIDAADALGCDTSRVFIEGWSWGGVVVLLTASVEPRVGRVAAVFGAGHLHDGGTSGTLRSMPPVQAEKWRQTFDPFHQTYHDHQQFYLVTGSNDHYFALSDNVATLQALGADRAHIAVSPGGDHQLEQPYADAMHLWAGQFAAGQPSDWATLLDVTVQGDQVVAALRGRAARVQWVIQSPDDPPDTPWYERRWQVADGSIAAGRINIDRAALADRLWYASVQSCSGLIASTAPRYGLAGELS